MNARQEHTAYEKISELIQNQGGRFTSARKKIIAYLVQIPTPQTIQQIANACHLDEVSVYRNIAYFTSLGFIEEIHVAGGVRRFSYVEEHHDHAVCTVCGYVEHVPCLQGDGAYPEHTQFRNIFAHNMTYYGVCVKCA